MRIPSIYKLKKYTLHTACLAALTALAACGGGGGGESDINTASTDSTGNNMVDVSTLQPLSTEANKKVYNLTASIGDTWQLTLDATKNTYTLRVLQTAFESVFSQDATGTFSQNGDTITASDFTLALNNEVGTISGQITAYNGQPIRINGQNLTVAVEGTAYAVPSDLSRLKGLYFMTAAMRGVSGNKAQGYSFAGQARIHDDGKSVTLCSHGTFNASGKCTTVDASEPSSEMNFSLRTDPQTNLVTAWDAQNQKQGVVNFTVNPLGGYTVLFDRLGRDADTIERTGVVYMSSANVLKAGDIDGKLTCMDPFNPSWSASLTFSGNSVVIDDEPDYKATETLRFNAIKMGSKEIVVNGIMESFPVGQPDEGAIIHPISKDTVLVEREPGYNSIGICSKHFNS